MKLLFLPLIAAGLLLPHSASAPAWKRAHMQLPRESHTATVLGANRILVTGGDAPDARFADPTSSAEIFDTRTNRWRLVAPMRFPRIGHMAVKLRDGRVLVAGGDDENLAPLAAAEAFSPSNGKWTTLASMPNSVAEARALQLRNGDILIPGGIVDGRVSDQALLYDPKSNRWSFAAPMPYADASYGAVSMSDGSVVVAGGTSPYAQRYVPARNAWQTAGKPGARIFPALLRLKGGRVLMAGGTSLGSRCLRSALVFDGGDAWHPVEQMDAGRCAPLATSLPDGSAVVGGGFDRQTHASMQRFDPATLRWQTFPALSIPSAAGTLSYVGNNLVAVGGTIEGSEIGVSQLLSLSKPL